MLARSSLFFFAFVLSLVLWTIALLVPLPNESARRVLGSVDMVFLVHKSVHVGAYAYLTIIGTRMTLTRRQRWGVLGLLSFHGFATEFFQQFVNRGASWLDVGIDHIGIALGLLASWRQVFPRRRQYLDCYK